MLALDWSIVLVQLLRLMLGLLLVVDLGVLGLLGLLEALVLSVQGLVQDIVLLGLALRLFNGKGLVVLILNGLILRLIVGLVVIKSLQIVNRLLKVDIA